MKNQVQKAVRVAASMPSLTTDVKVSDRKILIVPIATITHTPYNPSNRTQEGIKLRRLIDATRERGLVYPICITADRHVIDGNRRLAACRALGHETIECIVSDLDRDEAFTVINTTSSPIGGKGWLEIGRGGGYLPAKEQAQFFELRKLIGDYGIDLLIRQRLGMNVLPLCKSAVATGCKATLEQLLMAVAIHRLTNAINFEIRAKKSNEEKAAAIDELIKKAGRQ